MNKSQQFSVQFAGRELKVEIGKLAKQANAACTVKYGDTMVLATACMSKNPIEGRDFFPLQVEYREKMYAAGKIKGSRFVKREGRPTDNAVLDARMIDRGLRPLFNQKLRHEVQIVLSPLSYDGENPADILSIFAASLALSISDIPFNGPLAGICIGNIDGQMIINPTLQQLEQSQYQLIFSVGRDGIVMIDADGKEIEEEEVLKAFDLGIKEAQKLIDFTNEIVKAVGKEKKDEQALLEQVYTNNEISLEEKEQVFLQAKEFFAPQLEKYLFNQPIGTKRERKETAKKLLDEFVAKLEKEEKHKEIIEYVKNNFENYLESEVTKAILENGKRIDGRALDQIRPLESEIGVLPRTHGSGLFSRGETQVLSVVTLGAPGDVQILDEMTEDDTKKHYMHFYNSPPYAFGEPGMFRGAGRREVGHGALAEKALLPVLPSREDFPYTILVVSEVMASNGSSSMASTCGSSLSLMDAGVPIKKPVAGIAMGLASDGSRFKVLTDLQDFEDGEGGMDYKVAGTKDGITAIQMDTKTHGLSIDICRQAMEQAKKARLEILASIAEVIAEPRSELSPYAPRIETIQIHPDKIRDVIGPGGKIINSIIDECGVEIDIEDNGLINITGTGSEGITKAKEWISQLTADPEVNKIYDGVVTRLMDFGAFVEILPGKEGLVHISEIAAGRVEKVSDVLKVGDKIKVKLFEIDSQGRINLSIKRADPNYDPADNHTGGRPSNNNSGFRSANNRNNNGSERKNFGFGKRR